jgi:hypothetical protein
VYVRGGIKVARHGAVHTHQRHVRKSQYSAEERPGKYEKGRLGSQSHFNYNSRYAAFNCLQPLPEVLACPLQLRGGSWRVGRAVLRKGRDVQPVSRYSVYPAWQYE